MGCCFRCSYKSWPVLRSLLAKTAKYHLWPQEFRWGGHHWAPPCKIKKGTRNHNEPKWISKTGLRKLLKLKTLLHILLGDEPSRLHIISCSFTIRQHLDLFRGLGFFSPTLPLGFFFSRGHVPASRNKKTWLKGSCDLDGFWLEQSLVFRSPFSCFLSFFVLLSLLDLPRPFPLFLWLCLTIFVPFILNHHRHHVGPCQYHQTFLRIHPFFWSFSAGFFQNFLTVLENKDGRLSRIHLKQTKYVGVVFPT